MATIERRPRSNGTTAYRLKWKYGGGRDGAPQSFTYDDLNHAKAMKGAVESLRHLVYDTDPRVVSFELVTGKTPELAPSAPLFCEMAEQYISVRSGAGKEIKDGYRATVRNRMTVLLNRPIDTISEDDLRLLLTSIVDNGQVAKPVYDLLKSVFRYAHHKGDISQNPMHEIKPPKKRARTQNFLDLADVAILLESCRELVSGGVPVGPALADLCDAILGTGFRISEALGLIVNDVHVRDLDNAWIDVEAQLSRVSRDNKTLERVPLKTLAGQRRVVLDRPTAELFARLIKGKRRAEPVFTNPATGGWWEYGIVARQFERGRANALKAGMVKRPRIHDLRHTHAAWLLTDGVPLLTVSRRLGHESIGITANIYGHLEPKADDVVRAVMAARRVALSGTAPAAGPATAEPSGSRRPATRKSGTAPKTRKTAERATDTGKPRKASTDRATSTARSKGKGSAPVA